MASAKAEAVEKYVSSLLDAEAKALEKSEELKVNTSFDELKQGLVDDMNALIELRDQKNDDGDPVLDPKEMATVVGKITDIRAKLVDKFSVSEQVTEQRVVVNQKYNAICPYCHHELAVDPEGKKVDL